MAGERTISLTIHEIEAIYDAGRARGSSEECAYQYGSSLFEPYLDQLEGALVWDRGCAETRALADDYEGTKQWWKDFKDELARPAPSSTGEAS